MLNIYYGDMETAVYNTAAYFKYDQEDDWIIDPFVKEDKLGLPGSGEADVLNEVRSGPHRFVTHAARIFSGISQEQGF